MRRPRPDRIAKTRASPAPRLLPAPVRHLLAICLAAAAVVVAACGGGSGGDDPPDATPTATATTGPPSASVVGPGGALRRDPARAKVRIRIGSKNFTEQRVLAEIYLQGLAAAGWSTSPNLGIGDERATFRALEQQQIDAYPEYTGTALLSFFGKQADQLPSDPQDAYAQTRSGFAARGLTAFPPTPFTDSNEVAVTRATARRYGLEKISDLAKVASKLTLAGSPECPRRLDCLRGLQDVYGLSFKRFLVTPIPRRHAVLLDGRADISIVFTTDPQVRRNDEVLLEDDRGMFPPYNSTLVMRRSVAQAAGPQLARVVAALQSPLTDEAMQELDARVDLDDKSPADVAREYLRETGLVP